jgi:cysteine-rich repeat protein
MTKGRIAAAMLAVAMTATAASATTLVKTGGIFPDHGREFGRSSCVLGDGTWLWLRFEQVQSGFHELILRHDGPDGTPSGPGLVVAAGDVADWQLACGTAGNAVVAWQRATDRCTRYRLVAADHLHAGDIREAAPTGTCDVRPVFSVHDDGYAMAWHAEHPGARDDLWMQARDLGGAARHAPVLLTTDPQRWHSWPVLATDGEGNTVVAWVEGDDVSRDLLAAAVTADGEAGAAPVPLVEPEDVARLVETEPSGVLARSPGIFSIFWPVSVAGGLIGQNVAIAEVATQTTTTSTTTSTTLEDDQTPVFGGEQGWNREERSHSSIDPVLSGDGHGGWLAMWTASSGTTWPYIDHFKVTSVSTDSGRRWSRPAPIEGYPSAASAALSDGNGEWFAVGYGYVWGDRGWGKQVQLHHSTLAGTAWLPPRGIADVPEPDDDDCYATVNALDAGRGRSGSILVAWSQTTTCEFQDFHRRDSNLYVVRSIDNGATWTAPVPVAQRGDDTDLGEVRLVAVGSDDWLLAFGPYAPYTMVIRSEDDGASWGGDPGYFAGRPKELVCDSAARCVRAYSGAGDGFGMDEDIFAAVSDDAGRTWEYTGPVNSDALVDRTRDYNPVVATDDHGRWTAVWVSHHDVGGRIGLDADLLEAVSMDGGSTWSPPHVVSDAAETDGWLADDEPRLGYAAGAWVALWETVVPTDDRYRMRRQARVIMAVDGCEDGVVPGLGDCDDGNRVDGDGCDRNCTATGCGNGIRTDGEECDDGNAFDDDTCAPDCRAAFCGDGHVRAMFEECDDGNGADDDACTTACTAARCGDGMVARGVEECDDGNTVNEDACPNTCVVARCGDGYVEDGVEDCDDMNRSDADGCLGDCRAARCGDGHVWVGVETCDLLDPVTGTDCAGTCGVGRCGDANGDGDITATDAMGILSHSVGRATPCPMENCDVDGNLRVSSRDAWMDLGLSVGLRYPASCNLGPWVTLRLQDSRTFGALQVRADTSGAPVTFPVHGNSVPACESLLPGALTAAHVDGKNLVVGVITTSGFHGPVDLLRCRVEATGDVHPWQFVVMIEDATDDDGNQIEPAPVVVLRGVGD